MHSDFRRSLGLLVHKNVVLWSTCFVGPKLNPEVWLFGRNSVLGPTRCICRCLILNSLFISALHWIKKEMSCFILFNSSLQVFPAFCWTRGVFCVFIQWTLPVKTFYINSLLELLCMCVFLCLHLYNVYIFRHLLLKYDLC